MEKRVSKDMTIPEVLAIHPYMDRMLMSSGMHCVSCLAAQGETLEEAALVHGIEPELLEARLNAFLQELERNP